MAILDTFNELPLKQRVAAICGAGLLLVLVAAYFLYSALGQLGPAENSVLSFMLRADAEESIWGDVKTLRASAAKDKISAGKLAAQQSKLLQLQDSINASRERLPTKAERSKIAAQISQIVTDVNDLEGCQLTDRSVSISVVKKQARGRRKSKGPAGPEKTTFKCNLSGNLNGILKFFDNVEQNEGLFMAIDSIDIKPGGVSLIKEEEIIDHSLHTVAVSINTWVLAE